MARWWLEAEQQQTKQSLRSALLRWSVLIDFGSLTCLCKVNGACDQEEPPSRMLLFLTENSICIILWCEVEQPTLPNYPISLLCQFLNVAGRLANMPKNSNKRKASESERHPGIPSDVLLPVVHAGHMPLTQRRRNSNDNGSGGDSSRNRNFNSISISGRYATLNLSTSKILPTACRFSLKSITCLYLHTANH